MDLLDSHREGMTGAGVLSLFGLMLGLFAPLAVHASGTWKCETADGGTAYANNHLSDYTSCVRIANIANSNSRPAIAGGSVKAQWQYRETRAGEAPPLPADMLRGMPAEQHTRIVKGSVYKVRRASGVFEYTNVKPHGNSHNVALLFHYIATCRACDVHSKLDWAAVPLKLGIYSAQISKAAKDFGVDGSLLRALIHAESDFDPQALSIKGAQGLTQLMPKTALTLGVEDAFDPEQSIRGGARYLADLLKDFKGDRRLATAAYNAGEAAVRKYGGVPPYAETRVYVERVSLLAKRYRSAAAARPLMGVTAASVH